MHGEKLFRGIGSFSSAGSRPRDMEGGGGGGHKDPVIRGGGGGGPNYFFDPSGLTLV